MFNFFKKKPKSEFRLNYHVLNDSIVLNYEGKTHVVSKDDARYGEVLTLIRLDRLADIPEAVEVERRYNGQGIELKDGLFVLNDETMPAEISDTIIKFRAQRLSYDYLLKFWDNLKKNPSYNARIALFKFLEHNGIPFTQDGCFIAYRGVTEDFKDAHTGKFDNSPGSVCQMSRDLVDDNPNNTCSAGLHVACFDYAKGFASKLVEVKVNPADVVCVPVDYDGTKMRVCRFEVIQECAAINECLIKDVGPKESDERDVALEYEVSDDGEKWEEWNDRADDNVDYPSVPAKTTLNYRYSKRGPDGKFKKG